MGATLRPSHRHLRTRFLVNFFFVVELYNVNKTRGFGSKIEGTWARIGASWVKIGALVPPAKNVSKLFWHMEATLRPSQGPVKIRILVNLFLYLRTLNRQHVSSAWRHNSVNNANNMALKVTQKRKFPWICLHVCINGPNRVFRAL